MVYVSVPGLRGKVVDGEGRALPGAVVEVKGRGPSERIVTGEDGSFSAGEKSSVGMVPLFGDAMYLPVEVKAVVRGERERWSEPVVVYGANRYFRYVWEKPVVVDVGVLRVR